MGKKLEVKVHIDEQHFCDTTLSRVPKWISWQREHGKESTLKLDKKGNLSLHLEQITAEEEANKGLERLFA